MSVIANPNASLQFSVESVAGGIAIGWVRRKTAGAADGAATSAARVKVTVVVDGETAATDFADIERPDLLSSDFTDCRCGFAIHFGVLEMKNVAVFADGHCLFSESVVPQEKEIAAQYAASADRMLEPLMHGRQARAIFFFADTPFFPSMQRAQQLAAVLAQQGLDIYFIEPRFRDGRALRMETVQGHPRLFVLNLPVNGNLVSFGDGAIDAESIALWQSLLLPIVAQYDASHSIWCNPRWHALMASSGFFTSRIFDYHEDFLRAAREGSIETLLRQSLAVADATLYAASGLPLLEQSAEQSGAKQLQLRNGYSHFCDQFSCTADERKTDFCYGGPLDRLHGRWLRDFLQANPTRCAIIAGGGDLQPMFAHLATQQSTVQYLGEVPHYVQVFCLSRSRLGLFHARDAQSAKTRNPATVYEYAALGLPPLGPFMPDLEPELAACFTLLPAAAAALDPQTEAQAHETFAREIRSIPIKQYSWTARSQQLQQLLDQF